MHNFICLKIEVFLLEKFEKFFKRTFVAENIFQIKLLNNTCKLKF